ncbi:MAG: YgjV family protein [Firmicutes bacterium]|nr:YgjV family protein [Bacillota bacterium]
MKTIMIFAQILGFVAAAIEISSFQWKDSKKLFLMQIIFMSVFSVHYLLLAAENPSAYTGVLLNLAGIVRAVFLFFGDRQWARSRIALIGIMLLMAVCGIVTWEGWISLLPTAAAVVGTPFLWTRNGKTLRLAQLFLISPCWLVYNAIVFSVAGVLTVSFDMVSVIVSICRFGLKGLDYSMELQTENKTEKN